jgi:hypothetical protein
MTHTFPSAYSILCASEGSPVDLQRLENETLRLALEEQRVLSSNLLLELKELRRMFERRTNVLSPPKGFSNTTYMRSGSCILPLTNCPEN